MTLAAQARYQCGRRRNLKRVDYLLLLFVGSVTGMGKVLSATKALGLLSGLLSAGLASFLKQPMGTPFGLFGAVLCITCFWQAAFRCWALPYRP